MRFGTYLGSKNLDELVVNAKQRGLQRVARGHAPTPPRRKRGGCTSKRWRGTTFSWRKSARGAIPCLPTRKQRREALDNCKKCLALADDLGARCCVNIAGSRGEKWDGPHAANLTGETFEMLVATVREIIDAVKPTRTFYTLETMPWMYPDTPESYLALLIKAIDRRGFAVHFDPVNLISSPQRYFDNAGLMRDFIAKLGRHIRGVHCKDIRIADKLTLHLDECRPGQGALDHATLFRELAKLDADIPVLMEHFAAGRIPAGRAASAGGGGVGGSENLKQGTKDIKD